ncbi:MAG: twin-arginine translocase TatA/TatE family subunit [Planctomycetota bacterium]|nr:twin-arginine translocase TatA/TatE family subunit [Planctomycetota bacterium]
MSQLAFPGTPELGLILAALLLVFGAAKLPALARSLGSSITQFKKGLKDDSDLLEEGKPEDEGDEGSS